MRPKRGTPLVVWLAVLALAALAWVPFTAFYFRTAMQTIEFESKPRKRSVRVTMRPRRVKKKPKKEEIKIDPVRDMQVVDNRPPEVEKRPDKTRFLSNVDRTVKKQTKARRTGQKNLGAKAPAKRSKKQTPRSKSLKPTEAVAKSTPEPKQNPKTVKAPKAKDGEMRQRTDMARNATNALVPALDQRSAIANMQALTGSAASSDALQDVDEGNETVLDSRRFQHWDFFNTVKRRVQKHWKPARVHRRNDPTGKVYGRKDRLTVLQVTLDSKGKLTRLTTVKDSGVGFLDAEARRAFNKAAPFRNPPTELIDKHGKIVFKFGFLFGISSNKFKFFRMPM